MDIILYNNTDDNRKLNKSPVAIKTISVRLKDDTDIMHPVIELDAANLPPAANYCYIAAFNRYYYINQQGIKIGRDLTLTLSVDVLMSFKSNILGSKVVARRASNKFNKMLPDIIPVQANRNVLYRKLTGDAGVFGSQLINADSYCYCLSVLNGGINLNPPSGLTLTKSSIIGVSGILAKWNTITGAKFYNVDMQKNGGEWLVVGKALTNTEILCPAAEAGNWAVRVAATDNLGNLIGGYATATITI